MPAKADEAERLLRLEEGAGQRRVGDEMKLAWGCLI